jgi:hypothetical protein
VQVRCLLEGVPVEDILADWHGLLQEYMQRWQLDRSKVHTSTCASVRFACIQLNLPCVVLHQVDVPACAAGSSTIPCVCLPAKGAVKDLWSCVRTARGALRVNA